MLVFNAKLLKTRRINQIITPVYEDAEKSEGLLGYIYCDLDTYRQADTLMVRFEGQLDSLTSLLNITKDNMQYIEYFKRMVPYPFKMFAPYLGLIHESEKLKEDLEDLISHLHIIGRTISFSEFITVPQAARINVTFTKTAFLMMKEEIKDYTVGLYESERTESPDGVYWVNSEEIERVGKMADAISAAFGGMSVKSASQVASSFSADKNVDNVEDALSKENADFEDTFDPSEWEGFTPFVGDSDFSKFGGSGNDTAATATTTQTTAPAQAATQAAPAANVGMFEEEETDMDLLMSMAVTGADKTNEMMGG